VHTFYAKWTASISNATIAAIEDQTYTGAQITPTLNVSYQGSSLVEGTDYTPYYVSNINAGTATIYLYGAGTYTGSQTTSFTIKPRSLEGLSFSSIGNQVYTGFGIEPSVTVSDGGYTLVKDTDYTLDYHNNTAVGTASVTIRGINNFTATKTLNFTIVSPNVTPPDTKAPSLSGPSAKRTSASSVTIRFSSNEAGRYYYAVVESGAAKPQIITTGAGSPLVNGEQNLTINNLKSSSAKDVYLIAKDSAGNISAMLKVAAPTFIPANLVGWYKVDGGWYYYNAKHTRVTGWLKVGGAWYYLDARQSGKMATGVREISGGWFAFRGGDSGRMLTGWQKLSGTGYYFRGGDSGRAFTGWQKLSGVWYYFDTKTAQMATGVRKIGSGIFAFKGGDSGRMLTGWQKLSGTWYYFRGGESGRALTGWQWLGSAWYYFDTKTAQMATGWQSIGGKWYYLKGGDSGRMVTGKYKVGTVTYTFNSSGALVNPKKPVQ
jgi:glucan-binding YG repeat protein